MVDLIFILDRSWSLRSPENFQKELNFVAQVVSVLDFDKSRVSVVTFSDDADLNIKFNDYFRLDDFQRAVRALPWIGGNTYTHKAIEMMLQEYNQHVRDRAGITTIGVVVTDGGSTDPYKLEDVVKVVHNDRIEMFAIGEFSTATLRVSKLDVLSNDLSVCYTDMKVLDMMSISYGCIS